MEAQDNITSLIEQFGGVTTLHLEESVGVDNFTRTGYEKFERFDANKVYESGTFTVNERTYRHRCYRFIDQQGRSTIWIVTVEGVLRGRIGSPSTALSLSLVCE